MEPSIDKFATIVADPPWQYDTPGRFAKSTSSQGDTGLSGQAACANRYDVMDLQAIKDLPIESLAEDQSHLYLWTTNAFMVEAHEVVEAWGFKTKTILTWTKVKADGTPSMKMGFYYRGATEHVLFATRGKARRLKGQVGFPTAMFWPRTLHSVKPDAFYDMVEEASHGPYLELFARRRRDGWHHWGNEVESDVEIAI